MSLQEPNRATRNNHIGHFLERLAREGTQTGRAAFSFAEVCSRASIPRDLREKLLAELLRARYITREGDLVAITPTGAKVSTATLE